MAKEATPYHRLYGSYNPTVYENSVNRTYGCDFLVMHPCNVLGIRFYTHTSGAHDVLCKIWPRTAGAALKSKTVNVTGPGVFDCVFSTPLVITDSDIEAPWANRWKATCYKPVAQTVTTCAAHRIIDGGAQAGHLGVRAITDYPNWYAAGDAYPTSQISGDHYPVDVLVETPATVGSSDSTIDPTPFSRVYGAYNSSVTERTSVDSTVGCGFFIMHPCKIWGVRFYDHLASSHTVKITLWHPDGSLITSATTTISAQGTYEIMFPSPYAPTDSDIADQARNIVRPFLVGVYKVGQNSYTKANVTKFFADAGIGSTGQATVGARHHQKHPGYSSAGGGDAIPSTFDNLTEYYPVDPIITQIIEN